jgi:pimeloyl-ACP methyl ester carboxylesterase
MPDDRPPRAEPFTLLTPPGTLDDLRGRLRKARWPDAHEHAGWTEGTDLDYLRELAAYWEAQFDWEAEQEALNRLPHYRASVDGIGIHFIHAPAAGGAGLPIVLTHGWPDSFWRYVKVIPLLTDPGAHGGDPADAFDVVVPSMPGYGYSDRPRTPGFNAIRVAGLWAVLMTDVLGFDRFVAAGGDIGSAVTRFLGLDHADRVVAIHRTDTGVPVFGGDRAELREDERRYLDEVARWSATEGAYAALHRTKPQTPAYALNDSPIGLAAWIVEKLRSWSDCGGDVETRFTKDELLTNIMIYWVTGTIGSSMRMYRDAAQIPLAEHQRRVEVPCGFSFFPGDLLRPPRAWADRMANVARWAEMPSGGHFAPLEEPELYTEELRAFFRPYRTG